ncbi:MAG: P-loop NTPase [Acidobacteriota bacterium]
MTGVPRGNGPQVSVFASGKGGVGKTAVVTNLAVALALRQRQVMVLDADFGLANLDLALGLNPEQTLEQVLAGTCDLAGVALKGPRGITVLPAGSGVTEMAALPRTVLSSLLASVVAFASGQDHLLIDAAAGVSTNVVGLFGIAHRLNVVLSSDPTSLVDAYATIKLASRRGFSGTVGVVVNGASDTGDRDRVFTRLVRATSRFLDARPELLGTVPRDIHVEWAGRSQRAVVEAYPDCGASVAFRRLAARLDDATASVPGVARAWHATRMPGSVQ